jgi:hypothetical protein
MQRCLRDGKHSGGASLSAPERGRVGMCASGRRHVLRWGRELGNSGANCEECGGPAAGANPGIVSTQRVLAL